MTATKRIRERVTRMNNAWTQGAPTAILNGITQPAFSTRIQNAADADQEIANTEARIAIKKRDRDAVYDGFNDETL